MNRFKITLGFWVVILIICITLNCIYLSGLMCLFGLLAIVFAFSYITDHMNDKENKFFDKLNDLI